MRDRRYILKKIIFFVGTLLLFVVIALPSVTFAEGCDVEIRSIDAIVPTAFSGMTLQEIYGYQPEDGSVWLTEDVFEVRNEWFYEMLEAGELAVIRHGVYLDNSGVLHVDAMVDCEFTGMTLEEIYGYQISDRSTQMPTRVWDWVNGDALNRSFTINHMFVYTQYLFTGFSTYITETQARRNHWTPTSDYYTVYLMTGTGQGRIATSIQLNSTRNERVRWFNLDPGTRYAFAIGKANDASTLSGAISIMRP